MGESSKVYSARDLWRRDLVAVKLFHRISSLSQVSSRFHKLEAEAMRRLNHPNIARIFDSGFDNHLKKYFLVMEYVHGKTLDRVLHQIAQGSYHSRVEFVLSILDELGDALAHTHENAITHRDLKPENIIFTPDGTVKITDFGVAKIQGARKYTMENISLGTPIYMSPEQLTGEEVDTRSDIYALGIIIHNILSNKTMFAECGDFPNLLTKKMCGSHLHLPISGDQTKATIARAVAVKREDRFPRVEDFTLELKFSLKHEIEVGQCLLTPPALLFSPSPDVYRV